MISLNYFFKTLFFVCLFTLIFQKNTFACKCKNITSREAFNVSDTTIKGQVISIDTQTNSLIAQIKTDQDTMKIYTPKTSASCGYPFVLNKEYILNLYLNKRDKDYHTNACSKNLPLKGNEELWKDIKTWEKVTKD